MKNPFKLFVFVLLLSPSLLSAQSLWVGDATSTFTDSVLAFRVKVPFKKVLVPPANYGDQVIAKSYTGTDSTENTRYVFGFCGSKAGSFQMDDSSYYSGVKKMLEGLLGHVDRDTAYFMNDCFVEDLYGVTKGGDRAMDRYIGRGNGWYLLIADFSLQRPAPSAKVRAFFDSFSMLDYPDRAWHRWGAPDASLATWAPSPFVIQEDTSKNGSEQPFFLAFDSLHFNSYFIAPHQIPPYYWSPSDSAFYATIIATRILPTDSLVYKKPVSNGDAKGWEYMRKPKNGLLYERERILLNGDQAYTLYTYASKVDVLSANTNRFFEDFRFTHPVKKTHVFDPRAAVLLGDLFGADPARAVAALTFMPRAPFEKEDLTMLHSCLLKVPAYKANHHNYYVKAVLTSHIIHIHDTASFRWAADHYKDLQATNGYEKGFLLDIMANFPSVAHYSKIAELIHASPPPHLPIDLMLVMGNHVRLSAPIIPELLALPSDSTLRAYVLDLAGKLADSNLLPAAKLLPYRHELLLLAAGRIGYLSTGHGAPQRIDDALISLLGLLNTDPAILNEYLEIKRARIAGR